MEKNKIGVGKNLIYQFLYQFVILVIPLVVSPYLTRVVGSTHLGIYTFVSSITTYFIMFANLGIAKYGQRTIARCSHKKEELGRALWSLFTVHAIISLITIILYYIFSYYFGSDSKSIHYIQGLRVVAALFDITWYFYGIENFKSIVIRNTIVRIIETILIFIFVKSANDIFYLAMIYSVGNLVSQLVMIPQVLINNPPVSFDSQEAKKHIKPLLVFSISVIAVSLYTVFDKILLGWLTIKDNVAFYEYAERIISLPKTFIVVIGTVMFPRACNLAAIGDFAGQRRYLSYSLKYTFFIGCAALFGLLAVSKNFAYVYYGPEFIKSGSVMVSMCAIPLIVGLGDIIRSQYMIPNGLDKQYIICIISNAIINLVLSGVLIPIIGIYGAVIGTCSAELFGCVYQLHVCKKLLNITTVLKTGIPFFLIGIVMFACLRFLSVFLKPYTWSALLIEITAGGFIYILLAGLYFYYRDKDMWIEIASRIPFLRH